MTSIFRLFLLSSVLLAHPLARADVVADWNQIAMDTAFQSGENLEYKLRALAMVHLAMVETINFNEGRFAPRLLVKPPRPLGVSSDAAAAAAAHYVLTRLYPEQKASLAAALARSLAAIPDGAEKASGQIMGANLGMNIYAILGSAASQTGGIPSLSGQAVRWRSTQ